MRIETLVQPTKEGFVAYARVYYQRILAHAIDEELVRLIEQTAKDIITNSPELQKEIQVKALEYINNKFGVGETR